MKRLALTTLLCLPSAAALACATCGCTLSGDAATGYASGAGWRLNVEYDYLNQNQLRFGSRRAAPSSVAAINDAGGEQEVERATINRYTTVSLSYAPNADWAVKLALPYIDRGHTTYGAAGNPLTPDLVSGVSVRGLGDVKLTAGYQGFLPTRNLGVLAGVKLPTGRYGGPNAGGGVAGRRPAAFSSGPLARNDSPDNLLDTSLQLGTGSTDLIVGAYYFQAVSQDFDAFINGQFQAAAANQLNQAGQDFRPGNQATLSAGLRYQAWPAVTPQLQLNLSRKSHDQGALADTPDSAGTVAYLSPGVSAAVAKNLQLYGFVQLPVYSKLDGYQVFPRWSASVGLSYGF